MTNGCMTFMSLMNFKDQVWGVWEPHYSYSIFFINEWAVYFLSSAIKGWFVLLCACIDQRIGTKDLRLKLQRRRSIQQATQIIKSSLSGGTRDLREKLSGTVYSQTMQIGAPPKKLKTIPEVSKPSKRSVVAEAPASEMKNIASKVSKKKSQKKARISHLLRLLLQMRSCC